MNIIIIISSIIMRPLMREAHRATIRRLIKWDLSAGLLTRLISHRQVLLKVYHCTTGRMILAVSRQYKMSPRTATSRKVIAALFTHLNRQRSRITARCAYPIPF